MELYANDSILISRLLDHLGYSTEMVTYRRNGYKGLEQSFNYLNFRDTPLYIYFVGSKNEGLTAQLESDVDVMFAYKNVVCTENAGSVTNLKEMNVLKLVMKDDAPGYTFLRAINISNDHQSSSDLLRECLIELPSSKRYLSSDFWKHETKKLLEQESMLPGNVGFKNVDQENHGPSTTTEMFGIISFDHVCAIRCESPSIIRSWFNRERFNQWPPDSVIREVAESESHVVPAGTIYSSTQYLEWRICFTKGEIILVQSLNDCLTKCYILLKQIIRITLKSLCKDMTSYIAKNVIFWVAERNDYAFFKEYNLCNALKLTLMLLKYCVSKNSLPNYMIPGRNLLANRLTVSQRAAVCKRIDYLIKEGPMMVHRWKKIRKAFSMLYSAPEEFYTLSEKRHSVQVLMLLREVYIAQNYFIRNFTVADMIRFTNNDKVSKFLMLRIIQCSKGECDITEDDRITSEEIEEQINDIRVNGLGALREYPFNQILT